MTKGSLGLFLLVLMDRLNMMSVYCEVVNFCESEAYRSNCGKGGLPDWSGRSTLISCFRQASESQPYACEVKAWLVLAQKSHNSLLSVHFDPRIFGR